ncbi:uncharacterized protein F5891DRAFT_703252 [Suillus fuscotomentosus]|uniref:Golgi apparatus membrane protein TVP23 n=1 Tax=Suillus fuscotomentosus TaxID=1912939 RepID=A0AAD4DWD4_9AGAM|nr:uncharacterized protein F5891DRAFT_703252 [Suillus fuscotomentosus]KAG1834579.1 hypothetical protein EV424DRAFT_663500 [Suillus variegatus]KAG1866242.1 Golgi apparatus membrane protein TVP23 [Suillus tomentosus]KAG1894842.1 hypothetical protein F5891DRAFT_703252 [Suillus fuscotomentosus]
MSTNTPLLQTIEPDDTSTVQVPSRNTTSNTRPAVVLTPTNNNMASTPADAESGIAGILKQSAHPAALFCLYFFRTSAIVVYILCGLLTDNYVLSTVVVVVLLAMDFWNCRNVAGRTLVGLRFWNQVDDDGESYWVFESRDPSRPANPVDAKMFWIALYVFPALWLLLFVVSFLRFSLSFIPIVALALVFNLTNAVGFTYADRDAKQRWANSIASSGWNMGMGGIGGQILSGAMKNSVGRLFG